MTSQVGASMPEFKGNGSGISGKRRYPLTNPSKPKLGDLKRAIPEDCFQPSTLISISYIARDITFATALIYLALHIQYLSTPSGRFVAWTCYGFLQGCVGTGIWILAHECGHGALFPHRILNNTVGWILHSILLVPYFSWQISHAQHHRYTGHMEKDTVFVPHTKAEYASKLKANVERLKDLAEDTPLLTASQLLLHQLFGWQAYLLWSVSAGNNFGGRGSKTQKWQNTSHFLPSSMHFLPSHFSLVLLSDFGLGLVWYALWVSAGKTDWYTVTLIYGVPYLWVNHWLVAITFLHHTHPEIPHYAAARWTFLEGALGTIDRDFGFIGRFFFHGIIDTHVVHHLFPKIPFYKAEKATRAIVPLLDSHYWVERNENFLQSLWKTFRQCRWVSEAAVEGAHVASGVMLWDMSGAKQHQL